jgi:predicted oxidoreductase
MAWSPLAGGQLGSGARRLLPSQESYRPAPIIAELDLVAKTRNSSRSAIALAWLLKHPAGIIPILGSTNPGTIRDGAKAAEIDLTREEWYRLLEAARGERLP